jgi:hypothetical protein
MRCGFCLVPNRCLRGCAGSAPPASDAVLYHIRFSEYFVSKSKQLNYYAGCERVYERSPYLADWQPKPEFNNLTKHGFIIMIQRVFTIAGLQGPLNGIIDFLKHVRGFEIPVDDR